MSANLQRLVRDPLNSDEAPLLVLLHGLGSDERDLMQIATELDRRLRVVTLRAPHRWQQGGYAWFNLEWDFRGVRIDPVEVAASMDVLVREVEALKNEFNPSALVLGGFSQGAIMTMGVAARRPDLLSGAMLLSGRYVPETFAAASLEVAKVPFLVQHGVNDPVLEVAGARATRDALIALGAEVDYHEYPMGHEVSWQSLQDAKRWLASHLEF